MGLKGRDCEVGMGEDGGPLVNSLKCHRLKFGILFYWQENYQRILWRSNMIKYFREIIFVALGDG